MSAAPPAPAGSVPRGPRRRLRLAGLVVALLLVLDWTRAPSQQVTTGLELAAIARYQIWISPWLQRGGVRCRFTLSCSRYGAAVLARDGFVAFGAFVEHGAVTGQQRIGIEGFRFNARDQSFNQVF